MPTATPQTITGAKQILIAASSNNVANNATNLIGISGVTAAGASLSSQSYQFLAAGTLKRMVCGVTGGFNALTGAQTYGITLSSITGATALTCTINSTSTCQNLANNYYGTGACCEDTTHTVTVPAPASNTTGYLYSIAPTNTPTANPMSCSVEFDPS